MLKRFPLPAVLALWPKDSRYWRAVEQLETGRAEVENAYPRAAPAAGNRRARADGGGVRDGRSQVARGRHDREVGLPHRLPVSRARRRDAFEVERIATREPHACISGQVLRGLKRPTDCPAFGGACTPSGVLGATMVSAEGACAAYYQRGRYRLALVRASEPPLYETRVQNPSVRIVERNHQIAHRSTGDPLVRRGVEMNEHANHRPPLSPPTILPPTRGLLDDPSFLQHHPRPGVRQLEKCFSLARS